MDAGTASVDSSQMQLSKRQKQELLDRELQNLVEECRSKAHMDEKTLQRAAQPLFHLNSQHNRKACLWRVWKVFAVLTVISGVLAFDTTYRWVCIIGRLSSKKVVQYWDFTLLYDEICIVNNPYYMMASRSTLDCKVCDGVNVDGMEMIHSADQDEIANDYLKVGRPVIVRDGMNDWPCMMPESRLDGQGLKKLFLSSSASYMLDPCSFTVPRDFPVSRVSDVFDHMTRGEQVLAAWKNCDLSAAKELRAQYRRPYFFPGMAQSSTVNWVVVAMNGSLESPWRVLPAFSGQAVWVAMVEGDLEVTLTPQSICSSSCNPISRSISVGEILLYTTEMWYATISHQTKDEAIAIASSVHWDTA